MCEKHIAAQTAFIMPNMTDDAFAWNEQEDEAIDKQSSFFQVCSCTDQQAFGRQDIGSLTMHAKKRSRAYW